jgi:nicotinamidase-related amidase
MTRALMLIDVQRNMLEPPAPVPSAASVREALEDLLLRHAGAGAFVVHVQNDGPPGEPDEPGTDGWQLMFPVRADEPIVRQLASSSPEPGVAAGTGRAMSSISLPIWGGQNELPGVTPPRARPPHPQGTQEEGDQKQTNSGEQQVQQALQDNAQDAQRHRRDHQQ